MKKLNLLFTAILLLCCVGYAKAHDFEVDGIYYNITDSNSKTAEVTYRGANYYSYSNKYIGSVVIPMSVTYNGTTYSVTAIGNGAFYGCDGLTSITIPNSVTSIGEEAFSWCSGLTSITIPNSITSIGYMAFDGCFGIESIVVDSGNTKYDSRENCNAIIETESNTLIAGCKNSVIPNSVTSIGHYAFSGCSGLTNVTIPNSVTSIGGSAFYSCSGLTSIEIPCSVTSIGINAFAWCDGLTSITIPNSVTSIGNRTFYGCSGLTSVTIGNSVTSIGEWAFASCEALNEVHINDLSAWCSIDFYDSFANPLCYAHNLYLNNELITGLVIPNSITSIKKCAFYGCSGLTSVTIGNSVTSIGFYAFRDCSGLESIVVDPGNTKYDSRENCNAIIETESNTLLYGCKNSVIPNSVTGIGSEAFAYCYGLTSITIPNSVTSIGSSAFLNCYNLTSITIPNSVTSIGEDAFCNCSGLTSITIPNSVTSIGNHAFSGCSGLTSVTIGNSVTSIGTAAFSGCSGQTVINLSNLTLSKGSYDYGYIAYYADKVYNANNGSIEGDYIFGKPNNVNTLVGYLGCETELTLPADYKGESYVIGENVFKDNKTITSITIPNSVTSVVASAFKGCSGLEKVCISNLVAWCGIDFGSADANPLYYAKNLYLNGELVTNLSIPAEVTGVKDYAFYNCKGVANIDIVDQVRSIGNSAFYGCSDLETLYISNTIENIDDYAFAECYNILDIKIGSKKSIAASENIFSSDAYNNACLYVPEGRKFAYEKTSPWNKFYMQEIDYTGIEDINAENGNIKVVYDLQGRRVENPTNGIYIINGKKTFVK